MNNNFELEEGVKQYIVNFLYASIIYAIIGFSWGAIMGGVKVIRLYLQGQVGADLIVRAHTHINLLGWVEMAIFGAAYFIFLTIWKKKIFSFKLMVFHFWCHNAGLLLLVTAFTTAGVKGVFLSHAGDLAQYEAIKAPWMALVGVGGSMILFANIVFGYNIFMTQRSKQS